MSKGAGLITTTGNLTTSDGSIRSLVDGYLKAGGLKAEGISCHALRHSAATWTRAGGAKLDAIADMLGHSSTTTTQVYAQIVDKMSENPARYVEAVLATRQDLIPSRRATLVGKPRIGER